MKNPRSLALKVLYRLLFIVGVLTILHLIFQYINIKINNQAFGNIYEVTNRFDFDDEASIPTWFSQLLYLLLASTCFLTAFIERKKKANYGVWLTIGVIAVVGSIDEVATIHETGLQGLHLLFFDENSPTIFANAWIIIIPFVLAFAGLFLYKASKVLPKNTIIMFLIAASVYLVGAVGVDITTSTLLELSPYIEQGLLVALEEVMELIGLSLAVYTVVLYLETHYSSRFNGIKKQLRA